MPTARLSVAASLATVLAAMAGCAEQSERLNAPPQGDSARRHPLQEHFVYMQDNAILLDASIADIHFEPHCAELSGLGVRRLRRMGELLADTGGVIHYETYEKDQFLIDERIAHVREFLDNAGFDTDMLTIETGLARSSTISAEDAINIEDNASSGTSLGADSNIDQSFSGSN